MKSSALHIAAIILLGIVAFGIGIGKRDLWAPDEPRFGQVAREMIQRGDPFVLHVNGEPYSDKPPLHIWITVATTLLRGEDGKDISSFATRLPSVLGGLIGLLATYGIALILFRSTRTAFLSTIALATTLMYSWQAGRAQLDMLMAGWAIVAVLAWLLAERAETRPRRIGAWAAFWVAAALGTLSKGPPAVIVPLGAIGFYLMSRRDLSRTWRTAIIWSVAILLLTLIAGLGLMSGTPFLILTGLTVLGLLAEVVVDWLVPLAREQRGRLILTLGWFFVGLLVFRRRRGRLVRALSHERAQGGLRRHAAGPDRRALPRRRQPQQSAVVLPREHPPQPHALDRFRLLGHLDGLPLAALEDGRTPPCLPLVVDSLHRHLLLALAGQARPVSPAVHSGVRAVRRVVFSTSYSARRSCASAPAGVAPRG